MTVLNDENNKEIKVKLFAISKDIVGKTEISLLLPEESNIGFLRSRILESYPLLNSLKNQFALAVNHVIVDENTIISQGDEIALLPPVSGG